MSLAVRSNFLCLCCLLDGVPSFWSRLFYATLLPFTPLLSAKLVVFLLGALFTYIGYTLRLVVEFGSRFLRSFVSVLGLTILPSPLWVLASCHSPHDFDFSLSLSSSIVLTLRYREFALCRVCGLAVACSVAGPVHLRFLGVDCPRMFLSCPWPVLFSCIGARWGIPHVLA